MRVKILPARVQPHNFTLCRGFANRIVWLTALGASGVPWPKGGQNFIPDRPCSLRQIINGLLWAE